MFLGSEYFSPGGFGQVCTLKPFWDESRELLLDQGVFFRISLLTFISGAFLGLP